MDVITKKLLDFITAYRELNHVGPSLAECAAHVGMSKQGAARRLQLMQAANLVRRGPQHRSLEVVT